MSERFHIATFGCRTNQADTAYLREQFEADGFHETEDWTTAAIIVVNSCTVTHRSDQQVRQLVRRYRRDNPKARLVVTGCYAQREPESLARLEGVDIVVGNTHKGDLVQLAKAETVRPLGLAELAAVYHDSFEKVREIDLEASAAVGGKTRPLLKIQDGCDAKCSYCIIPEVRGPSRSVSPDQILEHARRLIALGFKEIVLTGIHIGTYGTYLKPRVSLVDLLARLVELPGLGQLRISSIEPMELSRRVIELAAHSDGKIAPHFHVCLQSGSDRTLKAMRRPYNIRKFSSIVEQIHELMPDAGIGTDIIVGFPGEADADHEDSLQTVSGLPFTYLHVFPYSDRTGTHASSFSEKVQPSTIRRRSEQMRQLSDSKNLAFRDSFGGRSLNVLTLDDSKKGMRSAISDNYIKCLVDPSIPPNQFRRLSFDRREGDFVRLGTEDSSAKGV